MNPRALPAQMRWGIIYEPAGVIGKAPAANNLAWLSKGRRFNRSRPPVWYHLGLASLRVGYKRSARTAFTAAVTSSTPFAREDATTAFAERR